MEPSKYKVLAHNELKDNGTLYSEEFALGFTPGEEKQSIEVICEECGDTIPMIVNPRQDEKPGYLRILGYLGGLVIASVGGVLAAFASSSTVIGVVFAVGFMAALYLIFGGKEPIKIARGYSNNLDKEGIHKKHEIKDMSPEMADILGIDPYKTF